MCQVDDRMAMNDLFEYLESISKCFILIAVQHTDQTQHDGFESQLWEKKYHVVYHPIHSGSWGEGNCLQESMIDLGSFLVHFEAQLRLRAGRENYK